MPTGARNRTGTCLDVTAPQKKRLQPPCPPGHYKLRYAHERIGIFSRERTDCSLCPNDQMGQFEVLRTLGMGTYAHVFLARYEDQVGLCLQWPLTLRLNVSPAVRDKIGQEEASGA